MPVTTEYLWMKHLGKLHYAAEGVTLSGVRKDEDCILTELWRRPFLAGAEGASINAISQAKGQSKPTME